MAEQVVKSDPGRAYVVYNVFRNMVTYECTTKPMFTKREVSYKNQHVQNHVASTYGQ